MKTAVHPTAANLLCLSLIYFLMQFVSDKPNPPSNTSQQDIWLQMFPVNERILFPLSKMWASCPANQSIFINKSINIIQSNLAYIGEISLSA